MHFLMTRTEEDLDHWPIYIPSNPTGCINPYLNFCYRYGVDLIYKQQPLIRARGVSYCKNLLSPRFEHSEGIISEMKCHFPMFVGARLVCYGIKLYLYYRPE